MSRNCITAEEIEGDREGTSDFVFFKIGSSVPLKRDNSAFDLSRPPGHPLAVSKYYGVVFLVIDRGFMAVKTVDVIGVAKDIKEVEKREKKKVEVDNLCIQDKSFLDVEIGNVHILAVSTDSSILAAVVGGVIHLFPISSLLQKKQEAAFVCSTVSSSNVKDFIWRKNREASFIVLHDSGQLYHGNMRDDLESIMDGVEAVDWSVEGNFLVVAKQNVLIILSSEYKERLSISLSFHTWVDNSDSNITVKVDSVKWVRSDSIIVGCVQVNEDNEETDYMVQVITTKEARFDEDSSKAVVVTFSDIFRGIVDDMVPPGRGPHLFASYLKNWDLAFIANRKNTDEHVVLLAWTGDDIKRPICLEFEQEKFIPRIDLQENGDENLLLGIDVDRVSIQEKLEFVADSEVKVLSPHCILLCLSCEGKLIMFHVARLSQPVCPPEECETPAKVDFSPLLLSRDAQAIPTGVKLEATAAKPTINIASTSQEPRTVGTVASSLVALQQPSVTPAKDMEKEQIPQLPTVLETVMKPPSSMSFKEDQRSKTSAMVGSGRVFSMNNEVGSTFGSVRLQSTEKPGSSNMIQMTAQGTLGNNITQGFPGRAQSSPKLSQDSAFALSFDRSKLSLKPETIEPVSPAKDFFIPGKFDLSNRFQKTPEPESKLMKQFYSVEDMTKELDALLKDIEQEGGFRDACTVAQRSAVLSLEEGIVKLSDKLRMCKAKVEEQLKEIQGLQARRMQVTARQIYMEGLVKQASNGQYWDLWNSQKLGPEFEVKQQRITTLNHSLVNELVELERYFHALELKKHGEKGEYLKGRRSIGATFSSSWQNYSLNSLHNTVNSQIAAAEQLSDSLSKHMELLKINTPPAKQNSVKKELLESIGLEYNPESFQSPSRKKVIRSPESSKKASLSSLSYRETPVVEPESSRRRRDSLDKSWTRFDPPKTTVKRMQQEERSRVIIEKPYSPVKEEPSLQVPKYDQKKLALQFPESQSSSLVKQTKDIPPVSSSNSKSLPLNVGQSMDATSLQFSGLPSSSPFKWAKDLPQVPSANITPPPLKASQSTNDMSLFAKPPNSIKLDREPMKSQTPLQVAATIPLQSLPQVKPSKSIEIGKIISGPSSTMVDPTILVDSTLDKSRLPIKDTPLTSKQPALFKVEIQPATSRITQQVVPPSIQPQTASQVKTLQSSETTVAPSVKPDTSSFNKSFLSSTIPDASSFNKSLPSFISEEKSAASKVLAGGMSSTSASISGQPLPPLTSSAALDTSSFNKSFLSSTIPDASSFNKSLPSSISEEKSAASKVLAGGTSSTSASISGQPLPPSTSSAAPVSAMPALSSSSGQVFLSSSPPVSLQITPKAVTPPESKPQVQLITADTEIGEEDEMEEEDLGVNSMLSLRGFALGQPSVPTAVTNKPNPFGASSTPAPGFSMTVPSGQLFRPAALNLPASLTVQTSQPLASTGFSGSSLGGFGQPAQIGVAQQALGSVLGSFGQSRQLGFASQGASLAPSSGFSSSATASGGFAAQAPGGIGGFASFKSSGFAGAATPSGGFGSFGSGQGSGGGFSTFGGGSSTGTSNPRPSLFTQMRK